MTGRIRDEDVVLVKEKADIAEVIGDHVTLRNAGGGNLKGLCPFHDEKTPSFSVRPAVGAYHCFGCQQGGDAISFVMEIDHLTFAEAVERLADRVGVQLRYEEGGTAPHRQVGQRTRLVEAHRLAAQFYAEQLAQSPDAAAGRRFLAERGFDQDAATGFEVGYSPRTWDALVSHLRGRHFTDAELTAAGLARQGSRGTLIDRFVGRLMWPIRDLSGDVVGFGARRLHDDDRVEAKYLNTADTPLFKKSQVLYGVDRAKREIARRMQAVVVEGYTDVMACHLAGVETAIATCGTAFGDEHIKVLRRLLMDQNEFRGEVVFTFDGDSAGQQAALRAFADDQKFVTQTFVAVEPSGMDPCELRQHKGDAAVRDLVARRVPLFEFAIRSILGRFDLDTPEGRVSALAAAAPVVARIRDRSLRPEYARTLAGWLGMEVDPVVAAVAEAARREPGGDTGARRRPPASRVARGDAAIPVQSSPPDATGVGAYGPDPGAAAASAGAGSERPDPEDPAVLVEREALKVAIQHPQLAGAAFDVLDAGCFTAGAYRAVLAAVRAAGGTATAAAGERWVAALHEAAADDRVRHLVTELAVEPLLAHAADGRYAAELLARLEELATTRRVTQVKSRLQRLNPVEEPETYNRLFGELVALEQHRRDLRERAISGL